jgi:hypothetical protein
VKKRDTIQKCNIHDDFSCIAKNITKMIREQKNKSKLLSSLSFSLSGAPPPPSSSSRDGTHPVGCVFWWGFFPTSSKEVRDFNIFGQWDDQISVDRFHLSFDNA